MSRDARYILSYEYQHYIDPTPMDLDKKVALGQNPEIEFNDFDNGFTVAFEMPKYSLLDESIDKLKADAIFVAYDGDPYERIR